MALLRLGAEKDVEPSVVGPNLQLRAPALKDWQPWAELRTASREFLTAWEPTWAENSLARTSFRRRIRRQLRDAANDLAYPFFLFRRTDDALLGGITVTNVQRGVAQSASIGYWIGKPHVRRGYMGEALHGVLAHSFGSLGLHRIEAACMPANMASQKLLESVGFRLQGYAREFLRINGRWEDHLVYDILADSWNRPDWIGPPKRV